jgi:hypothetical protein
LGEAYALEIDWKEMAGINARFYARRPAAAPKARARA